MLTANTTGNQIIDEELDALLNMVKQVRASMSQSVAAPAVASSAPPVGSSAISAAASNGTYAQDVSGVTVDTSAGLGIASNGDGTTLINLTLVAGAGIGISAATISNAGVTSWNGMSGAVVYTPPATSVAVVTSDPASPTTGQVWYRSDLLQMCIWDGSAVRRSSVFT